MTLERIAGATALVSGLAMVPVLHFAVVDLEGKQAADAYLAHVDDNYLQIALMSGLGMVLAAVVFTHLLAVRRIAGARRPLLADVGTTVASVAALGILLSSAMAWMAAYGAHEEFPFEVIRPLGALAENLFPVLSPGMAGAAVLVAVLGLRDGILPRWLGFTGAGFGLVLAVLAVVLPPAASMLSVLWLVVVGVGLLLVKVPEQVPEPAQA